MVRSKQNNKQTTAGNASTNLHMFFNPIAGGQRGAATAPPEIIVIESDDEELAARPNLKRAVEWESEEQARISVKKGKLREPIDTIASFGTPTLLLGLSKLESSSDVFATDGVVGSSSSRQQTSNATMDVVSDLIANDDWEMGDDEFCIPILNEPSIDPQMSEEPFSTPSSKVENCPVCGERFLKALISQLQKHINECLDGPLALKPPSKNNFHSRRSVTPKPLHALCSLPSPDRNNAFSVLMSSHKENEAWKEAETAEKSTFKSNKGRRTAPFYKVLQGMPIAIDAFRYGKIPGVTAYFLTHAHSDHYTNLSSSWKNGPIYCSQGTASLIIHMLSVDPKWVHALSMDVPITIPNTGGVQVTLIEANHCPGSCIFLFEGVQTINAGDSVFKSSFVGSPQIFRYLHCGDFRASPRHVLHPAVKGKRIDHVYLDTTYLDPKYCFPPQLQVISACAKLAEKIVLGEDFDGLHRGEMTEQQAIEDLFVKLDNGQERVKPNKRVLIVVGTYSVGKERVVSAIAKSLQTKIYCDARKAAIIRCQSDPDLESMLTDDPLEAGVHIVPLSLINLDKLRLYADRWKNQFSKVVGFRPTGWTYILPAGANPHPSIPSVISRSQQKTFTCSQLKQMKNSSLNLQVYAVPYSEHSSFFELTCFALSLDWDKMIATVNVGSDKSRAKMSKWFERWESERKKLEQDVVGYRNVDYW